LNYGNEIKLHTDSSK